jgi:hypothetical protein
MSFAYRQVTISGHRIGTEGTSKALNEIVDVMVNQMGWVLNDDRRAQAGNASIITTHKVALRSNLGESGDQPQWHVVLTSGVAAAVQDNSIGCQISTAYDTAAHDVPGTGIETPADHTNQALNTDSDAQFILWISGNKDGVVLVTQEQGQFNWMSFGRSQHFLANNLEPYGLYLVSGNATANPNVTQVPSIAGQPPQQFLATEAGFIDYPLATTNQPQYSLGETEAIFTAFPLIHVVNDSAPVRKGAIGICNNFWSAVSDNAGIISPTEFVVSGTGERYMAFGSTTATLLIRKS